MRTTSWASALAVALTMTAVTPAAAQSQYMDAEFNAQWGLAVIGAQYALARSLVGTNVPVGVADDVFLLTHPEFAGRIFPYEYNPDGDAADNHGTHVAGIIGAARNGVGMEGVAPGALLSTMNIYNGNTRPEWRRNLAIGYDEALAAGIRIFNNSWGLPNGQEVDIKTATRALAETWLTPELIDAFHRAVAAGSVIVFAAGNQGMANPDIPPGLPYLYPELKPGWLAVTSVKEDRTFDTDVNACGVASRWCLAAPGEFIYSTGATGGNYPYYTTSGTSMAAPHVSGALAIARDMFPAATGPDLVYLILKTAKDLGDGGVDPVYGWGLLSVENLVAALDPASDGSGAMEDDDDGNDNGALFVNASYARFAAVDTLVATMWDRSANRVLQQSGTAPSTSVAQAMAPAPIPPMALGGPIRDDVSDTAVTISTGRSAAVWAQGLAAHASLGGTPRSTADLGGAIGGYDLFDNGTLSGGIAIAYTRSDLDTKGSGNDSSATGWHGYAYATWQENNWFVDGVVGGNWFDNTYKRTTIGGTNGTVLGNQGIAGYSSNDTTGVSGRLAGGHVYAFRDGALLPYAYVNLIHQKTGGSAEQGADIFSLDVDATSLDQVEGGIGTRAQMYGLAYHGFTIAPAVDLAYGRLGGDASLPVGFDLLGNELAANAGYLGRNVLRVGTQLDVLRLDDMVGGFLAYDGRFQENAQNNTFSGGLIVRF